MRGSMSRPGRERKQKTKGKAWAWGPLEGKQDEEKEGEQGTPAAETWDQEVRQLSAVLLSHASQVDQAGKDQGPGLPSGLLVHEMIEASGLSRGQVRRALLLLQDQGRVE